MTSYKTFGELNIPLETVVASPGGLSSVDYHYTGGMYGPSSAPHGDYDATDDYLHGQKGELYPENINIKQKFDFLKDGVIEDINPDGISQIPMEKCSCSSVKTYLGFMLVVIASITLAFMSYNNSGKTYEMIRKFEPIAIPSIMVILGTLLIWYY